MSFALDGRRKKAWASQYTTPIKQDVNFFNFSSTGFPILSVVQILATVFGDYQTFKNALNSIKQHSITFSDEDVSMLLNALVPLSHLAHNAHLPDGLYASRKSDRLSHATYSYQVEATVYDLPVYSQIGPSIILNVNWNANNQYEESKSFYEKVTVAFDLKSRIPLLYPYNN
ncbi:hypothetical protein GCM10027341_38780 [Spirosoma knui]